MEVDAIRKLDKDDVTADAVARNGTYTATQDLTVGTSPPADNTLSISALRAVASEYGQVPDTFRITRTGGTSQPLTANFSLGGDATLGTQFIVSDAGTGQILTGSATIPAGALSTDVLITPLEDHKPGWTDTVTGTLTGGNGYSTNSQSSTATTEIVDHDLGLYLGNGSGNIILQGSSDGTQNLVPLVTDFPQEAKQGAQITLTVTQPGEVDVWTTPTPGPNDTPILGDVNGTNVGSVVETYSPTDPLPATLWVGGTNGSTAVNDIQFTAYASDETASRPGATTTQATTKPAEVETLQIVPLNDPNGSKLTDWSGQTIPWLVGQMVALKAQYVGPEHRRFHWTISPNDALIGRYVDEPADQSHRKVVNVTNDDGGLVLPDGVTKVHTGWTQQDLAFFWYGTSNPAQPEVDTVTLTATSPGRERLGPVTATFDVYTPSSRTTINDRVQNPSTAGKDQGDYFIGLIRQGGAADGIDFRAWVNTVQPGNGAAFKQGIFTFTQLMKIDRSGHALLPNAQGQAVANAISPTNPNVYVLDTSDPYGRGSNGAPNDQFTIQGTGWLTDDGAANGHHTVDTPRTNFFGLKQFGQQMRKVWLGVQDFTMNDAFQTYLVYQPPGNQPAGKVNPWDSQWVPLAYTLWSYDVSGAADLKNGTINIPVAPTQNVGTEFAATTSEPTWAALATAETAVKRTPLQ